MQLLRRKHHVNFRLGDEGVSHVSFRSYLQIVSCLETVHAPNRPHVPWLVRRGGGSGISFESLLAG